jgi:hypothetical protein
MCSETDRTAIKRFVRETLGCACPDDVLTDIEYYDNVRVGPDCPYSVKFQVGHRLLIYLLKLPDSDSLQGLLPIMLSEGKRERDNLGFNRFRAVVVTDRKSELALLASRIFAERPDKDDKIHFHVLASEEMKELASSRGRLSKWRF